MQEIMASSDSTRNSNNASSFMYDPLLFFKQVELWCDHCAWRVRGQRFDDGIVCCGFCGKILEDSTVTDNARGRKRARRCRASSSAV
ncbi:hypothetical protein ACET3Z_024124 [Daucus carota]